MDLLYHKFLFPGLQTQTLDHCILHYTHVHTYVYNHVNSNFAFNVDKGNQMAYLTHAEKKYVVVHTGDAGIIL